MNQAAIEAIEKSSRFWDRTADRYAKKPIADLDAYKQKVRLTQTHFTQKSRVLEFGCGTGSTALIHAPKVESILAIDFSQKMIEIANRKLADTNLENVEFRCNTLFDLDDHGESFDVVLGLNVLHLIPDYRASVQRAYEMLKPGGVFITSTVCMSPRFHALKPVFRVAAALGLVPRVQFMSVDKLHSDIAECRFAVIETQVPTTSSRSTFLIAAKA